MGSYLLSCGVTGRTLQDDDKIRLVFLHEVVLTHKGTLPSHEIRPVSSWENLIIKGKQSDCGNVIPDEDSLSKAVELMVQFHQYEYAIEGTKEWNEYVQDNVGSIDTLKTMSNDAIIEHFNELLGILHNGHPYFRHPIQGDIVALRVSHVDESLFTELEKMPHRLYSPLRKDDESSYEKSWLKNFNEYLHFVALYSYTRALDQIQQLESKGFFSGKDGERRRNTYTPVIEFQKFSRLTTHYWNAPSYFCLMHDWYEGDSEETNLELFIANFINQKRDRFLLEYAQRLGVRFSPSYCVDQDYPDERGRSFRELMARVSLPQKKKALSYQWESEEEDISQKEFVKKYMAIPEVKYNKKLSALSDSSSDLANISLFFKQHIVS